MEFPWVSVAGAGAMVLLAFLSVGLIFFGAVRLGLADLSKDEPDEKPNFANRIMPLIHADPVATALFYGLALLAACHLGAAVAGRFV